MENVKIFIFFLTIDKTFCAKVVTTNGFALNRAKSLQIYFFCVKRPVKKKKKKKKKKKRLSERCQKEM